MIIEIRGSQTINKGAELMLLSVMHEVSRRCGSTNITFVVEPHKNMEYEKRIEYGLLALPRYRKRRINWGMLTQYLPRNVRLDFGIVTEDELDVIIDVSGFKYGDFWGLGGMEYGVTNHIKRWKRKGIKVLLLPQAFGPFEKEGMGKQASIMLEYCDLICARDDDSFKYLNEISTKFQKDNLYQFPDFTPSIVVEGGVEKYKDHILIIPNSKMLQKDDHYQEYLENLVNCLHQKKLPFSFLIHEGESDYKIAKEVVEKSDFDVEIIWDKNPIQVKKIIKSSKLLIASRFHGLINGLSQGIPSLSTSWSHKYNMVLDEYEFLETGFLEDLINIDETIQKIEFILNNYLAVKNKIVKRSKWHKERVDEMWDQVMKIIDC